MHSAIFAARHGIRPKTKTKRVWIKPSKPINPIALNFLVTQVALLANA